ncbi:hypothetical protein [Amycolatopsis keratiniphila]|uniref:Uncharacterized protein n=1 Tax=Amycolatopsis keratiniphila TaxID=129921 RepID=R4TJ37_9PSEU|nr:hypothetical protein [Amycolatopsis keratiniphila]AGM10657.1 hypothetical protein AORI_8076 [Amycolatopsis keratiniphila]
MKTALRGLIGWFALAVVLVGANTLVQIQRDPDDPGYTQVDGFVRVALFATFIIALLVVTKIGFVSVVQALTFGAIKPEKTVAEKAAITFDIPETEEGGRTAANIVAVELFLIGLGLLLAGGAAGWALLDGGGFTALSVGTFLIAGLAVYPLIPMAINRARDSGRTWPIEITFTPVGMSQPVGEGQKTVAWPSIDGFVFDRHRGGRRVDVHIAISDERGRQQLLPIFGNESEHGFLMTTAMDPAEAERAEATIERFKPGSVEWRDKRVRRGGFGPEKPDDDAGVVRWGEPDRSDDPVSAPHQATAVVARESQSVAVAKGIAAWSESVVLVLTLSTVILQADALAGGMRFLVVAGIAVALAGILAGVVSGRRALTNRFVFRRREIRGPWPLPADVVAFGIPDNAKFVTRVLVSGLNGIGLITFGGGLFVVADQAGIEDGYAKLLGAAVFAIGLFFLGSIAFHRRETTKYLRASVTDEGLEQPAEQDETLVLSWDEVGEVILDEHIAGGRFSVHVALAEAEAAVLLHETFRKRSRFGHRLTTTMTAVEAERFATLVESRRPGLVRRPARKTKRGGFGVFQRAALRWTDGTTSHPAPQEGLSISKVVDSGKQRRAGFIALAATVVLGFGIISDTGVAVRVVAGLLGLSMFSAAIVSLRRDQSQVIREVVLKPRWITVTTLTSRTWCWSVRWSDIEKVVLRRAAGTDVFHVVLSPSKSVDAYYPRERLARTLGLKREENGDILIAETALMSEDVEEIWPVLERNAEVTFDSPGIDDPCYLDEEGSEPSSTRQEP